MGRAQGPQEVAGEGEIEALEERADGLAQLFGVLLAAGPRGLRNDVETGWLTGGLDLESIDPGALLLDVTTDDVELTDPEFACGIDSGAP
ncbi:MAG: hypothetical protein WEB00_03775 [Dehalococcoidia bacterium]